MENYSHAVSGTDASPRRSLSLLCGLLFRTYVHYPVQSVRNPPPTLRYLFDSVPSVCRGIYAGGNSYTCRSAASRTANGICMGGTCVPGDAGTVRASPTSRTPLLCAMSCGVGADRALSSGRDHLGRPLGRRSASLPAN